MAAAPGQRWARGLVVALVGALCAGQANAGIFAERGRVAGGEGADPAGLLSVLEYVVDEESRPFGLSNEELVRFKEGVIIQYKRRTRASDGLIRYRISGTLTLPTCATGATTGTWSFRFFANEPEPTAAPTETAEVAPSAEVLQDVETLAGDAMRDPVIAAMETFTQPCPTTP